MNSLKSIMRSVALTLSGALALSSLVIMPVEPAQAALYTFQSHTFTTCGKTTNKHLGPTLANCKDFYSTDWDSNTSYFDMPEAGIQRWTVPATGLYEIRVAAAEGGSNSSSVGGRGAWLKVTVNLTQGEKLRMLVGQTPEFVAGANSGGGGGSFIWYDSNNSGSLIAAAGGGGGGGASSGKPGTNGFSNFAASRVNDGLDGSEGTAQGSNHTGNPGTNGNGGDTGGAGWLSDGVQGDRSSDFIHPKMPRNGGEGGWAGTGVNASRGGFGGGSGGGGDPNSNHGAGGGGGYSGGAGQEGDGTGGGGGGSYRNTAITNFIQSGSSTGDGQIQITALGKFSLTAGNGAVLGLPMVIAPVIQLKNLDDTAQTANGVVVTVSVNGGASLLAGTETATSVNGVATFSNLTFASGTVGNNYTLTFTATGYSPAATQTVVLRSLARTIEVSSSPSANGAFYNGIWLADNTNADSVISSTALAAQLDARPVTLLASASPTTTRMGSVIVSAPVTVSAVTGAQLAISASQEVLFTATEDSRIVSENGPLDLTLQSNSQGGTGRIQMLGGSAVDTNGGDLLALGSAIEVASTIATGVGDLTLKSLEAIEVSSGANLSTTTGDLTLWSDSDADNSGSITIDGNSVVGTSGGDIVLSGGSDVSTGYAIGDVGIEISNSTLNAGSGAVVVRGKSNKATGSEGYGVYASGATITGNSLTVLGFGSSQPAAESNNHHGVFLDSTALTAAGGNTTITGTGSITSAAGASSSGVVMTGVAFTGQAGDLSITGTGSVNTGGGHHGVSLSGVALASSGSLSIQGKAGTSNSDQNAGVVIDSSSLGCNFTSYAIKGEDSSSDGNGIWSDTLLVGCGNSSAPISILADGVKTSTSPSIILNTQGPVNVETFGEETLNTGPLLIGNQAASVQIGNSSKDSTILIGSGISTSGNVSVYGSRLQLFASITSSGNVLFKSTGGNFLHSGSAIETAGGDVVLWSAFGNPYYGAIGLKGASISTNGGDLVLGGGADSDSDGSPDGYARTENGPDVFEKGAVEFLGGTEIRTSGGNLVSRGQNGTSARSAIYFEGDVLVDVGAGKADFEGLTSGNVSGVYGIRFSPSFAIGSRATVISSSNTAADSIVMAGSLQGVTGFTLGAGIGSKAEDQNNDVDFAVSINTLGGISLSGVASSAGGRSLELSSMELVSGAAGTTLTGTGSGQNGTDTFGIEGSAIASRSSVIETAGTLELRANSLDISTIDIDANSLVIEPTGTSFVASGSFDPLTGNLKSDLDDLRIGKSGNLTAISISQAVTASGDIVLFGGNVGSSADLSATGLAVAATGTVLFTGDNDFDTVDVSSSKGDLADGDIVISDADGWVFGNVSADVAGQYGKPRYLDFVTLPSNPIEESAFEVSAKVGRDHYGLAMAQENLTQSIFTITKATGAGTITGASGQTAVGGQSVSFSNLVLTGISQDGSTLSFTISGSGLDPTTSGEVFFIGLPSTDSRLSGLVTSQGTLTPSFDIDTRQYSITVPNGTGSLTLTPTANDQFHSGIEVNGNTVTSGAASAAIGLVTGNNVLSVVVTAEDGSTSSYVVNVFRQLSQQVDWVYGDVSITQPNGSVSTASAFTDMYGDTSRNSALSDDVTLDEDGLPQKTITLKVGEVLHLPMTSNHGNAMGYGGITGVENQICKINSFKKTPGSQSGHYTITALRAGACDGVFVSVHQRTAMVMLSLGARGIDLGSGYFRTPHVKIVVERKDQTQAAIFNGTDQATSTAAWNEPQTLEIRTTEQMPFGNKSYSHVSGPCTVTTKPAVLGGVSYFFMATAEVVATATGTGACVIEGSQAQDTIYNSKTWSHTITFGPATQALSFTSNVPAEPIVGSTYSPAVTSSAMLAVTLGVTTGNGTVCTINGSGEVSFIATGSCTIQATGTSNANYQAPAPISQTLVVGTANQSITFNQIPDKEIGDTAFRAMANATSGLVVSFTTVTSNTICTVSTAGLVTIVGEGQCSVTANQAGNSQVGAAQSVTRVFTIRPEGSSAPFITAVSYGDGSLTATLIAPSYTGGNSILDYSLFAYNAGNQNVALVTGCDASAIPVRCTVTGLTNGQPYTLKAAARTSAGLGSLSGPSQAVTPLANPQAVNGLTALAGNETLTITWQPPSSLGGGDFARFDIRIRPAGGNFPGLSAPSATISAITESSYVFTGLQNGVSYDVEMITITTEPASGMSAATLQSHTARVLQTPFTRPNAPRNLAAFEVDNAVKIAFAYPDFDGGRQVDEYRVSVNGTTVCTPTQIQVCSVPMATLTSLMSSPFVGGIGFQQQPGSFGFLSTTTTQIPIEVVAVNDGGTSDPATTTYDLVTGSSTPPPSSGGTGVVGAITNLPTITSYSKQVLQSTGDSFTITGTNFALIAEIWASNTKLSFIRSEDNLIRITTPELPVGPHSLVLLGSFGVVTVQDAVSVIQSRIVGESTRITRTFVDGFTGRSTYLGPTNVAKLRSFVAGVKPGTVVKCYGSIPDRAKMDNIKLAFKRADRVCDFVQSLNPNIEVVRTWVWKDGNEAWGRSQVRLTLFEY